jgi:histidine triad (HIT) family protein
MPDCLFCKMINGEIPIEKLGENEKALAFKDISPQAPVHALVIPKKHIATTLDIKPTDAEYITSMITLAQQIAEENNIDESGYRWVINTGKDGNQTVFHLHLHILGGRALNWPPG